MNIYRSEKEQQGSEGSENNLGDTVNSPSPPPPLECSVTHQIQSMDHLKESLSAATRRGEISELAVTGQSVVPFVLPCGLTVPCVLPRGSDSGSERGAEAQAAASPDPVSGWEGALRHFLVPTGLRRGMRLSLRGHGTGFLPAGAERGRGNLHCHAMRGCGGSSRVETLSRRYGPKHHAMWDGPLACVSDADHPACGGWPVMVCWLQYGPSIMSPLRAWSPGKD